MSRCLWRKLLRSQTSFISRNPLSGSSKRSQLLMNMFALARLIYRRRQH